MRRVVNSDNYRKVSPVVHTAIADIVDSTPKNLLPPVFFLSLKYETVYGKNQRSSSNSPYYYIFQIFREAFRYWHRTRAVKPYRSRAPFPVVFGAWAIQQPPVISRLPFGSIIVILNPLGATVWRFIFWVKVRVRAKVSGKYFHGASTVSSRRPHGAFGQYDM